MQPQYDPTAWHSCDDHDYRTCTEGVNCYSYALNQPEYYWAVPGLGYTRRSAEDYYQAYSEYFGSFSDDQARHAVRQGAIDDGLIRTTSPEPKAGFYLTALFFSGDGEPFDFHWYRRDQGELWSHKNGYRAVSNTDDAGKSISDPRLASHGGYPVFGGLFLVPEAGIELVENDTF